MNDWHPLSSPLIYVCTFYIYITSWQAHINSWLSDSIIIQLKVHSSSFLPPVSGSEPDSSFLSGLRRTSFQRIVEGRTTQWEWWDEQLLCHYPFMTLQTVITLSKNGERKPVMSLSKPSYQHLMSTWVINLKISKFKMKMFFFASSISPLSFQEELTMENQISIMCYNLESDKAQALPKLWPSRPLENL